MATTIYSSTKVVRAVNTTSVTTNGNTDGVAIGLDQSGQDFRSIAFVLMLGDVTDGVYTAVPQESADGSTGWTSVPADRLQGAAALSTDHAVGVVGVLPNPGTSPFLRLRVTSTTVTTGGPVSAVALLSQGSKNPVQ